MRVAEMDWRMVEDWVREDDRAVLPIGSTEQHAGLSLATDTILAERVAVEAAEPLGVPVFPAVPYGLSPYFQAFPGSVTLRVEPSVPWSATCSTASSGRAFAASWWSTGMAATRRPARWRRNGSWTIPTAGSASTTGGGRRGRCRRCSHTDPLASHGSWMENYPWTRLPTTPDDGGKRMVDLDRLRTLAPFEARNLLEDGNFGGCSQRSRCEMWRSGSVAVEETREMLDRW